MHFSYYKKDFKNRAEKCRLINMFGIGKSYKSVTIHFPKCTLDWPCRHYFLITLQQATV